MRISDWSSDVCSSDLHVLNGCEATKQPWKYEAGADETGNAVGSFCGIRRQAAVSGRCRSREIQSARGHRIEGAATDTRRRGSQEREPISRHLHLRSEEHTSELQSLMRISYAVFC